MEPQKTQNFRTILRKKNKAGGIPLPNFKQYNKATVIKRVWCQNNNDIYQWNRIESRNKPTQLGQLILDKGGKYILQRKDSLFSKWCWKSWTAT